LASKYNEMSTATTMSNYDVIFGDVVAERCSINIHVVAEALIINNQSAN